MRFIEKIRGRNSLFCKSAKAWVNFEKRLAHVSDELAEAVLQEWPNDVRIWTEEDFDQLRNMLVIRRGGMGDLLQLTPALRHLRKHAPDLELDLCCCATNAFIFNGNKDITHIKIMGTETINLGDYEFVANLHGVAEQMEDGETSQIDLLASWFGFTLKSRRLVFNLSKEEQEWGRAILTNWGIADTRKVAIFTHATAPARIWPKMREVAGLLREQGFQTLVWADNGRLEEPVSLSALTPRQSASLMSQCDAVLTGDTGPLHLAAALDIPTIGIFLTIDPKVRTKYYKKCVTFRPDIDCFPCSKAKCDNQLCADKIDVREVTEKVVRAAGKKADA